MARVKEDKAVLHVAILRNPYDSRFFVNDEVLAVRACDGKRKGWRLPSVLCRPGEDGKSVLLSYLRDDLGLKVAGLEEIEGATALRPDKVEDYACANCYRVVLDEKAWKFVLRLTVRNNLDFVRRASLMESNERIRKILE